MRRNRRRGATRARRQRRALLVLLLFIAGGYLLGALARSRWQPASRTITRTTPRAAPQQFTSAYLNSLKIPKFDLCRDKGKAGAEFRNNPDNHYPDQVLAWVELFAQWKTEQREEPKRARPPGAFAPGGGPLFYFYNKLRRRLDKIYCRVYN